MANRRQRRDNRPYYNNGPVNPWQGGNIPGGNPGVFNAGMGAPDMLSQLTEPQAQLALALSKLLQPQQSMPSLLTMNTVNPMQNLGGGYRAMSYGHRSRDDVNRRSRSGFKRNEPYNKMSSRNSRDKRRKSPERKVQPHRTTVVTKTSKPSSSDKTSPKSSEKTNESITVQEEPNDDTIEMSQSKEESETEDKKRDWKDEKPTEETEDVKKDNSGDEAGNEAADDEQEEEEDGEKEEEQKTKKPKDDRSSEEPYSGRYKDIPASLLHCYICDKKMWDALSFEKHTNGRAHQQMLEKVEESCRIKSDMMREAIRLSEEKNNIEIDRMKRLGKRMKSQQRSHCAMCDLDFYGLLFMHRKSASHQKLKHFLHPKCNYCNKEFANRMEWENHRLTPEHLLKRAEELEKKKDKKPEDDSILIEDESFPMIDIADGEENEDDIVIDFTDDIVDIEAGIPTYKKEQAYGVSLIESVSGFYCKPCTRFFLTEQASREHAKTQMHYDVFASILQEKITEKEQKKRKGDEAQDDDEGNWKRRKTSKDEDGKSDKGEKIDEDGSQLYDPAETFITDPNDISLVSSSSLEASIHNKVIEVLEEVEEINELLNSDNNEEEEEEKDEKKKGKEMKEKVEKEVTEEKEVEKPKAAKPSPLSQRRTRAKKN